MATESKILKAVNQIGTDHEKRISRLESDNEKVSLYFGEDRKTIEEFRSELRETRTEIRTLRESSLLGPANLEKSLLILKDSVLQETDKRYASKGLQSIIITVGTAVLIAATLAFFKLK